MHFPSDAGLPPARKALWRSMRLGYQAEPWLLAVSLGLVVAAAVPDALFAFWLKLLAQGLADDRQAFLVIGCAGLGGSAAAGWLLKVAGERVQRRFQDRATITLESHVAGLQAAVTTIEHQERPELLDRLAVLRDQVFTLSHLYGSVFSTLGVAIRLAVVIVLLLSIHPALGVLVAFAIPPVAVSSWRSGVQQRVDERAASDYRLARHLFVLGTTAPPGKEVRVSGAGERLIAARDGAWRRWYGPVMRASWVSAIWLSLAWALFGMAYVAAIVFVTSVLEAPPGDVLLVLAATARLSQYVGMTVGEASYLRFWMEGSRRMVWLEDYAREREERADIDAPDRIREGIRFEHVSFRYPGSERLVLDDVTLELPPGAVVALVGENGAGKTTLVKLLSKFYEPTSGRVTVDGADLGRISATAWRERMAGAYQDFYRFEFDALRSIGLGELTRAEEPVAVGVAVGRAGAEDVVARLPEGLATQLGRTWNDGEELSFGQWQKLALARGFMRDRPLVLVLDEPTAALDAETEHALFERFAAQARAHGDDGRITILVSHRFSTVRMADLIVVLDGSRIAETGTHDELMAAGGPYSELYSIQASGYR